VTNWIRKAVIEQCANQHATKVSLIDIYRKGKFKIKNMNYLISIIQTLASLHFVYCKSYHYSWTTSAF